eukprot:g1499.t1
MLCPFFSRLDAILTKRFVVGFNNIDFEDDFNISLDVDDLPEVRLDMRSFRDGTRRSFSLLDTPGPNEAKAFEALEKLGPRVMKTSTGCIFCIPWDQVASNDQMEIYVLINTYMAGKTIVIVVTKWDACPDPDREKPRVQKEILKWLNPDVKADARIHFTSGWQLLQLYDLEELLASRDGSRGTFYDALLSHKDGKLFKNLDKMFHFGIAIESMKDQESALIATTRKYLEKGMADMNAEAVLAEFRFLYDSSEKLAANGQAKNLLISLGQLRASLNTLSEYVGSGDVARREAKEKRRKVLEVDFDPTNPCENIYFCKDGVGPPPRPGKYKFYVHNYRKRTPGKTPCTVRLYRGDSKEDKQIDDVPDQANVPAFEFTWEGGGGSSSGATADADGDRVFFNGGLAEMNIFLRKKALPTFQRVMQAQFFELLGVNSSGREIGGGAVGKLREFISEKWSVCTNMIEKLEALDEVATMDQVLVYKQPPEWGLDFNQIANATCTYDIDAINYTQEPNRCVLSNTTFKTDVLREFNKASNAACEQIQVRMSTQLGDVLDRFEKQVESEQKRAQEIVDQFASLEADEARLQPLKDMLVTVMPKLDALERKINSFIKRTAATISTRSESNFVILAVAETIRNMVKEDVQQLALENCPDPQENRIDSRNMLVVEVDGTRPVLSFDGLFDRLA